MPPARYSAMIDSYAQTTRSVARHFERRPFRFGIEEENHRTAHPPSAVATWHRSKEARTTSETEAGYRRWRRYTYSFQAPEDECRSPEEDGAAYEETVGRRP